MKRTVVFMLEKIKVPGKLFFMGGFHEGDPCPGQIKEKRKLKKKGKNIIITV